MSMTRRAFQAGAGSVLAALLVPTPVRAASADPPEKPDTIIRAQARLAAKLLSAVADDGSGAGGVPLDVVLVSPMSAALCLSILAPLAGPEMQTSIGSALQFGSEKHLAEVLDAAKAFGAGRDGSPLTTADLLLLDQAADPVPYTLDGMRQHGIEIRVEDLGSQAAVDDANAWVRSSTHDLIPTVLDGPPGAGGLVVLNALHFQDAWQVPFDPARTADAPFHGADGKASTVRMMRADGEWRFRQENGLIAVDLPFRDSRYSLVVMSRTDGPPTLADLTAGAEGWFAGDGFETQPGAVALPRLDLAGRSDLLAPLTRLGLRTEPLAALGSAAPTLRAVNQRVAFKVDERGAEAAATTVGVATRSMGPELAKVTFEVEVAPDRWTPMMLSHEVFSHAQDTSTLCARVPAADGRSGPRRPRRAGSGPRV